MTSTLEPTGNAFTMPPCSACSNNTGRLVTVNGRDSSGLHVCDRCGALLGRCYRGDSPVLMTFGPDGDETRYFDLDLLGSDGVSRVHGFFNPATMKVVQFG